MTERLIVRTRSRIEWMGRHSGYDRGCDFLEEQPKSWRFADLNRGLKSHGPIRARILNALKQGCSQSPLYDSHSFLMERELIRVIAKEQPDLVHLMYLETDLGFLTQRLGRRRPAVIATAHQPSSWWKLVHRQPEVVRDLDGLIVLTAHEAEFWEEFVPGRVYLIHHGIDVDFFSPGDDGDGDADETRFITVGNWLRDLESLSDVVGRLIGEVPGIGFDCVFPNTSNPSDGLLNLARRKEVRILTGLSDEELREHYRFATALLLPMIDATANNAILEAQACGTPIVSTDLPGILDYVDASFADLRPVGDVAGLVEAAMRLIDSSTIRENRGRAARSHAVNSLSWEKQAPRWLEVYDRVLERRG